MQKVKSIMFTHQKNTKKWRHSTHIAFPRPLSVSGGGGEGEHPPREPQNEAIPGRFRKKTHSPKVAPQPALKGSGGRLFGALGVLKKHPTISEYHAYLRLGKIAKKCKHVRAPGSFGQPQKLKKTRKRPKRTKNCKNCRQSSIFG